MSMANRIYKEVGKKIDLDSIKEIIELYEKIKNDVELLPYDYVEKHMKGLIGHLTAGDSIRAYRDREGITQKELAQISGVKRQHISEIERGIRSVGVVTAKKLAKALNCNYRSLL